MTGWYGERTPDRSAKAVIAVTLLALLLVAAVPVALLAGVVMMMLGHVVGGLALFGGLVLAAAIAVGLAGMSGMRHLRKLVSGRSFRVVRLDDSQYIDVAEPQGSRHDKIMQLDRSEYTEVRLWHRDVPDRRPLLAHVSVVSRASTISFDDIPGDEIA
jgi:hypothetical protein